MALVTSLHNVLRQFAPEAPAPLINRVLIEAAQDLCSRARVWREYVTPVTLDGSATYTVTPPTDGELVDVLMARVDDTTDLDKMTQQQIGAYNLDEAGPAVAIFKAGLNSVGVARKQTSGSITKLRCSFKPTDTADEFSDDLLSEHRRVIEDGAIGRLLSMKGKPWADAALAGYYLEKFDNAVDALETNAVDEGMVGVARVVKYGGY